MHSLALFYQPQWTSSNFSTAAYRFIVKEGKLTDYGFQKIAGV
jgi:hypothetical protein